MFSTRIFFSKRAKLGERKPFGCKRRWKSGRGGGGVGLLLDTTGSRKHEAEAVFLPPEANQILEPVGSVTERSTSSEASTAQGHNNNR